MWCKLYFHCTKGSSYHTCNHSTCTTDWDTCRCTVKWMSWQSIYLKFTLIENCSGGRDCCSNTLPKCIGVQRILHNVYWHIVISWHSPMTEKLLKKEASKSQPKASHLQDQTSQGYVKFAPIYAHTIRHAWPCFIYATYWRSWNGKPNKPMRSASLSASFVGLW